MQVTIERCSSLDYYLHELKVTADEGRGSAKYAA
jgi:hypothetical protein